LGGPKGAGALIARGEALMPRPLIQGCGQERGHRSGTQNSLALIGFGAAAEAAIDELAARNAAIGAWRERLEAGMRQAAADLMIHCEGGERVTNTI
ncbi:cysteine desulfurase, partial [Rhizobium leguminosarum]